MGRAIVRFIGHMSDFANTSQPENSDPRHVAPIDAAEFTDHRRTPPAAHRSRRDVVRQGMKLAFVAPLLSTFFAREAYAVSYSCYPAGHACPGIELCCSASCNGFNQCD